MVRASITNENEMLRPGMLMTVQIITNDRMALVIPESAFIQTGNESYVFIAGEDGQAHRRVIKIGSRKFGFVEVVDGLQEGDKIITEGGFKLQDKSPYRINEIEKMDMSHLTRNLPYFMG